jgi:DNA-binding NtrC family response regulator
MISTCQSPSRSKTAPTFKNKGRVLIACEDGEVGDGLVEVLKTKNLKAERAVDFTSACKLLKTGKFQVVFATPRVPGGSWEKLLDFAHSKAQALAFVIVARSFDLSDWGNCLKNGAFEVLDSVSEISRAGEVAMQAISAAWATAGHEATLPGMLELHDLSPFSANCSKVET